MDPYEQLASQILFSRVPLIMRETLDANGLEFRKGKTQQDLVAAVSRGRKQGNGKVEHELGMIEIQLHGVLKKKKVTHAA